MKRKIPARTSINKTVQTVADRLDGIYTVTTESSIRGANMMWNKTIRSINFTAVIVLVLLIAGCTVGPNYKTPKTKLPQSFPNATASNQPTNSPDQFARWWTTLQDPVLDSLIDRAVRGNLDLKLAQARVREARAQRGVVAADLYPDVNAAASYQRNRVSKNVTIPGTNFKPTNNVDQDLYQVGFDASWEIDVFGGVRRDVEAANADIATEVENTRDVLVTLVSEVARNYVDLRSAQREIDIARSNLQAQQETLDLTKVRFDSGLSSNLDVSRAEAQVQTT